MMPALDASDIACGGDVHDGEKIGVVGRQSEETLGSFRVRYVFV